MIDRDGAPGRLSAQFSDERIHVFHESRIYEADTLRNGCVFHLRPQIGFMILLRYVQP